MQAATVLSSIVSSSAFIFDDQIDRAEFINETFAVMMESMVRQTVQDCIKTYRLSRNYYWILPYRGRVRAFVPQQTRVKLFMPQYGKMIVVLSSGWNNLYLSDHSAIRLPNNAKQDSICLLISA